MERTACLTKVGSQQVLMSARVWFGNGRTDGFFSDNCWAVNIQATA